MKKYLFLSCLILTILIFPHIAKADCRTNGDSGAPTFAPQISFGTDTSDGVFKVFVHTEQGLRGGIYTTSGGTCTTGCTYPDVNYYVAAPVTYVGYKFNTDATYTPID